MDTLLGVTKIVNWSQKLVSKALKCKTFEMSGKIPVCWGLENVSATTLENLMRIERAFGSGLSYVFILVVVVFLVYFSFMILYEDVKSLKNIRNKVTRSVDTLVTILRAMLILKSSKKKNMLLEEEVKNNRKARETQTENIISCDLHSELLKVHDSTLHTEPKLEEPIEFAEKIEPPSMAEWCPTNDDENIPCPVETAVNSPPSTTPSKETNSMNKLTQNSKTKQEKEKSPPKPPLPPKVKPSPLPKDRSVKILYERKPPSPCDSNRNKKFVNTDNAKKTTTASHELPVKNRQTSRICQDKSLTPKCSDTASTISRGIFFDRKRKIPEFRGTTATPKLHNRTVPSQLRSSVN